MAIDKLSAIDSVLAQMRQVAQTAAAGGDTTVFGAQAAQAPNGGFASELAQHLEKLSGLQNQSATQARAFQAGDPNVSLNDVMVDMQKSSIAFQTTVQARNRLVAAYQEIASMPL